MVSTCARGCLAFARVVGKFLQSVVQRLQADAQRGCGALLVVPVVRNVARISWRSASAIDVPICTVIVLPSAPAQLHGASTAVGASAPAALAMPG